MDYGSVIDAKDEHLEKIASPMVVMESNVINQLVLLFAVDNNC